MNPDLRNTLEAKREEKIVRTTRKLLDGGPISDVRAEIEEIDVYSKLLAVAQPRRDSTFFWALAIGSLCVVVVGILWSVRVRHTDVSLALDTNSLAATLAEGWHIENGFDSHMISVEGLSTIRASNLGLSVEHKAGEAWFRLEGEHVALQALEINSHASIELVADQDELDVYVSRERLTGKVTVTGKINVMAGSATGETLTKASYRIDIPETVEFSLDNPQSVPSRFSIRSPGTWSFGHPQLGYLNFTREDLKGAGERLVTSGLKGGTVRFNDTAWTPLELREGEFFGLKQTEAAVVSLRSEHNLIHVSVAGLVGSVTVGNTETKKQLAPSYLEYLYNKKSLAFFWSAVALLWGLMWSARNMWKVRNTTHQ